METSTDNYFDETITPVTLCYRDSENKLGAQLSTLYYFMFVISIFGNVLVLVIIYRFEKLTNVTNIFLLNLVVSSLIFMSSLPFMGVYMQLSNWIFGVVMCHIVGGVYYLGFYSSVLFLTLLTFDRHLTVVYSLSAPRIRNQTYAIMSCAVVWLVSCLACIKQMILYTSFYNLFDNKIYCQEFNLHSINVEQLIKSDFYIQLILFLIFPLVVIFYCYVRIAVTVISSQIVTKFKTVRLVFIIVLLFFMCWIPFNIAMLMHDKATTCEEAQQRAFVLNVTRSIAYIYFCISPIFYTFVGKKFQNYFIQGLEKHFPRLKKHVSVNQHSRTNMSTKSTPNNV